MPAGLTLTLSEGWMMDLRYYCMTTAVWPELLQRALLSTCVVLCVLETGLQGTFASARMPTPSLTQSLKKPMW